MQKNIVMLLPIVVIGIVLLSLYNSEAQNPNIYLIGATSVVLVGISGYIVSLVMKNKKQR